MLTIGEIKILLNRAAPDLRVRFDFCGIIPTTIASYRGYYDRPALGWEPAGYSAERHIEHYPEVADLLKELDEATSGKIYTGWKGGEYTYNDSDILYVDNPGDYSLMGIVDVIIDDYSVTLKTETDED